MKARVVSSFDRVGADAAQWNALAAQSGTTSVFQTYEWTQGWCSAFADQDRCEPLFVTVSNAAGVIGIAPLVLDCRSSRSHVIRFVGDRRADYCDFLAGTSRAEVVRDVFETLFALRHWDVIDLNNVPSDSETASIVRTLCREAGYRVLITEHGICPTLLIEGHEEAVRKIVNKASLRRRENYFRRAGPIVCHNFRSAPHVHPYLDRFFEQHVQRWTKTGIPSLFLQDRNRAFYRQLTDTLGPTGWLLFSVIEFQGEPVAFHYGFDYMGTITWYKPSFDARFASRSPGLVLVRRLISFALEHRRRELDFALGAEPFKARFTNSARKTSRIQIFRDPVRHALEHAKRRLIAVAKNISSG